MIAASLIFILGLLVEDGLRGLDDGGGAVEDLVLPDHALTELLTLNESPVADDDFLGRPLVDLSPDLLPLMGPSAKVDVAAHVVHLSAALVPAARAEVRTERLGHV